MNDWSGHITVLGAARSHRVEKDFARNCQMVFQDPYGSLHPRKTVDTVLSEPLQVHGLLDRDERVASVLAAVGLDRRFRYRYPHQLSGGQRQWVAIARALVLEPKVMLLDVSVQAEILNLLKALRRDRGLTYLLVTHNLPAVSFMCDRMAIMRHGRIRRDGGRRNPAHRRVSGRLCAGTLPGKSRSRRKRGHGMNQVSQDLATFQRSLSAAVSPEDAYDALRVLGEACVGAKLFTVMTVNMEAGLVRRAYTSDTQNYPATGTKSIERNAFFDVVFGNRQIFVANTIEEIATVFGDHELIASLGCASVVNLPVIVGDELVATINLLHEAGYYTEDQVAALAVANSHWLNGTGVGRQAG